MPIIEIFYPGASTLPITLASLADGGIATTAGLINSSASMALDVQLKVTTGASVSPNGFITLYFLRGLDGINFDDVNENAEILGIFDANSPFTTYVRTVNTVDIGTLPEFYKIAVKNNTGDSLDAIASNHSLTVRGMYFEVT